MQRQRRDLLFGGVLGRNTLSKSVLRLLDGTGRVLWMLGGVMVGMRQRRGGPFDVEQGQTGP